MDSAPESQTIDLPERLDSAYASELYNQIDALKGDSLSLNGADVLKVGGLCLQVILSAQDEWNRQKHTFHIHTPSEALSELFHTIGRADILTAETPCR